MHFGFTCTDCDVAYKSAGCLLKHFAEHVADSSSFEATNTKKSTVPDLYPISLFKNVLKGKKNLTCSLESEENVDSGIEDANPVLLCTVSIGDEQDYANKREKHKTKRASKKYKCNWCLKTFGWSTDLKRHMLIHTGERPFKCTMCDDSFTRKFLLQKHHAKQHFHDSQK